METERPGGEALSLEGLIPPHQACVYGEIIYYIRRAGLIKIGQTWSYDRRMYELCPDAILAVQHGDPIEEREIHARFKAHRAHEVSGREWFHPGPELVEHIAAVRSECGVPPRRMRERPVTLPHHTPECRRILAAAVWAERAEKRRSR